MWGGAVGTVAGTMGCDYIENGCVQDATNRFLGDEATCDLEFQLCLLDGI